MTNLSNVLTKQTTYDITVPEKTRLVSYIGAKYHKDFLNDHFYNGLDLLSNLKLIIIRFRLEEFAVLGDTKQIFQ